MNKTIVLLIAFLFFSSFCQIKPQSNWINGFEKRIAGENLDYHSCHPDANLALLNPMP